MSESHTFFTRLREHKRIGNGRFYRPEVVEDFCQIVSYEHDNAPALMTSQKLEHDLEKITAAKIKTWTSRHS